MQSIDRAQGRWQWSLRDAMTGAAAIGGGWALAAGLCWLAGWDEAAPLLGWLPGLALAGIALVLLVKSLAGRPGLIVGALTLVALWPAVSLVQRAMLARTFEPRPIAAHMLDVLRARRTLVLNSSLAYNRNIYQLLTSGAVSSLVIPAADQFVVYTLTRNPNCAPHRWVGDLASADWRAEACLKREVAERVPLEAAIISEERQTYGGGIYADALVVRTRSQSGQETLIGRVTATGGDVLSWLPLGAGSTRKDQSVWNSGFRLTERIVVGPENQRWLRNPSLIGRLYGVEFSTPSTPGAKPPAP